MKISTTNLVKKDNKKERNNEIMSQDPKANIPTHKEDQHENYLKILNFIGLIK